MTTRASVASFLVTIPNMNTELAQLFATVQRLSSIDPIATWGQIYLAVLACEKTGVDTGLTRQSLTTTKSNSQSKAAAGKGIIVSNAANVAEISGASIVLSPLGKFVASHPSFTTLIDAAKWTTVRGNIAQDTSERDMAKLKMLTDLGMTKLPEGVKCDGCGKNLTRNQDKFSKHFCLRSKTCKILAARFYQQNGAVPNIPEAAKEEPRVVSEEEWLPAGNEVVNDEPRKTKSKKRNTKK